MRRYLVILAALLGACSGGEGDAPMAGMTAEEHARMQSGGGQGEIDSAGAMIRRPVHLTPEETQTLGIVFMTVQPDSLLRTVRTVGSVRAAEPNVADVTPKISGFVEELFVNFTGQSVERGQPLLTLYSPQLVAAQEELLTARRLLSEIDSTAGEAWRNALALLESSRRRLSYWDITDEQIATIEETGVARRTLTLVSPVTGIVLDKRVLAGQQVMPGMLLYRLADLSTVWVEGDVFEQDLQFVRAGMSSHIEIAAYPGDHVMGRVSFVYPVGNQQSRTITVRVSVPNGSGRLKPGMFATVFFDVAIGRGIVVVPMEAVLVTGERNLVFVRGDDGMLVAREVVLGPQASHRVQVLSGLAVGETIVSSANFLIDAESRLGDAAAGMPGMQHDTGVPAAGNATAEMDMERATPAPAQDMNMDMAMPAPATDSGEHNHDR